MSHSIIGYNNRSDNTVLNKSIVQLFSVIGDFKITTDIVHPTINISAHSSVDFSNCNYLFITQFNRYYFIKSKSIDTFGNIMIDCECDVLMSHKNSIKSLEVIAKRSSSDFNMYQYDSEIPMYENQVVATQKFPYGFSGQIMILSVNNGGINQSPNNGGGE